MAMTVIFLLLAMKKQKILDYDKMRKKITTTVLGFFPDSTSGTEDVLIVQNISKMMRDPNIQSIFLHT